MARPREVVPTLVEALRDTFEGDLQAAILKGSVLRDDHIPFWSDLDIHAFVRGVDARTHAPDWARALAFQRAIGKLDPEAYEVGFFQVSFLPHDRYDPTWPTPFPSAYEVLAGTPPFGEPSVEDHLERARGVFERTADARDAIVRLLVDKTDAGLRRPTRLLGSDLNAHTIAAAMILSGDPERVVRSRRAPLIHVVGEEVGNERELIVFDALANDWREVREHPEELRAMLAAGIAALEGFLGFEP